MVSKFRPYASAPCIITAHSLLQVQSAAQADAAHSCTRSPCPAMQSSSHNQQNACLWQTEEKWRHTGGSLMQANTSEVLSGLANHWQNCLIGQPALVVIALSCCPMCRHAEAGTAKASNWFFRHSQGAGFCSPPRHEGGNALPSHCPAQVLFGSPADKFGSSTIMFADRDCHEAAHILSQATSMAGGRSHPADPPFH